MEHPNLALVDYDKLNTFSRMFELDWRGDRSLANKSDFLASKPIYISENDRGNIVAYTNVGPEELSALVKQACTPFVEGLCQKLLHRGILWEEEQER